MPRLRRRRPDGLPRHLEPDAVRTLIDAVRGDSPRELRDHAMLLMMARLGLRGQEVIAVRLGDIDWRAGTMIVRGKAGQSDRMPLPVDVGEDDDSLDPPWQAGYFAPLVCLRAATVSTADIVPDHRQSASSSVPTHGPDPTRGPVQAPCAAAQPGHGPAGPGRFAGRDRRCSSPPVPPIDPRVRAARYRCAAAACALMARAGSDAMIALTQRVEQYLAQRKRFGTGLSDGPVRTLRRFARFADSRGVNRLTTELFLCWKQQFGSAGRQAWVSRLSHVRIFARWLQSVDPRTEVPPRGLITAHRGRPRPYIYTDEEIAAIVTEAARLPSNYGLRGPTHATLFGLLAVTGLRISEAVGLDRWGCGYGRGPAQCPARQER